MAAWVQLSHPEVLPATFIEGKGLTEFKVNMEYLISALCLVAAVLMFYRSERGTQLYWVYLGCAALIMMFSEFYFTLYATVTDIYNLLGHIYKVIAYSLIYQAVFVASVREPYRQIQQLHNEQLATAHQLREAQHIAHLGQWELEFPSYHLTWSESIYALFEIDATQFGATYAAFLAVCHPDDRQKVADSFATSVREHTPYEFVHRLLMSDGRIKWVKEIGVTEYDENGQPERTKGVVLDITNIMNVEAQLRDSERRMQTIIDAEPDCINILSMDCDIKFMNKPGLAMIEGDNLEQAQDKSMLMFVDPTFYPALQKLRESVAEGQKVNTEFEMIGLKGTRRWVETVAVPFVESENAPLSILAISRDVTARKKLEHDAMVMRENLAQAQKMDAIGKLTAGIAHDFNNILGAMLGYIELSQHMISAGTPDPVARYLGEMLKAGTRAKELIAQMLAFSRLSPENQGYTARPIMLGPILNEVVSLLRSSIPTTIELDLQIEDESLSASIQPVNLHQIILNLGINARDAMGEYGKITITLSRCHNENQICASCNLAFRGDHAKITLKDSGAGISATILNNIFDPFFTTKGVGKGIGMGLSVVHGLVHAAGGHIQVQSSADSGTAISILLPIENADLTEQGQFDAIGSEHGGVSLKGVRIVVVDDEQAIAAMLHEFLSINGAQVLSFNSSLEALETLEKHPELVDLLITDETMPGLSGMHLAERMLKLKPKLPIILCTGHSDHATPDSAHAAGLAAFFFKPLKLDELLLKVQELAAQPAK